MILGIETSCDETAAALLDAQGCVVSSVVASQRVHELYRGVVPEIASREHTKHLVPVIRQALSDAGAEISDLTGVAVTAGPGLVGSLLVGLQAAKAFASARGIPFVGVNHLEGHALSPFLEDPSLPAPAVVLVASGGHTILVRVHPDEPLRVLGRTRDDAAGEAFDKVSVMLGLGYPGGGPLEKLASSGDPRAFDFPQARLERGSLDFSFSGVKTAVRMALDAEPALKNQPQSRDVAASFQAAVVSVLVEKTMEAARREEVPSVAVAGGVAANAALRGALEAACASRRLRFVAPRMEWCGDNAAMIAFAGKRRLDRGERDETTLDADPNLPLAFVPNRAPRRPKRRAS
ncbi:MAG: tRNA (adenosine(37)-N6)-threonylcarbamoyltransferase complex transferase subunit TsaD [Gemmatimonadota bacterium]|nr:tRNA (adenosine(37)-N6)-threonylcarbamoyltransferase complex transferase subunit TsaD [Gemmatimonadota bacterium]MDP6803143.1 tRNA (adenosine(37)-N6)-threonylcarbamoyltransferase complex transferase subunit TsaD [Gemmatimonadota bacterium]